MARLEEAAKTIPTLVAHYEDFDRIFDAIVAVKTRLNVHNSAAALVLMARLAFERLKGIEEGNDGEERGA